MFSLTLKGRILGNPKNTYLGKPTSICPDFQAGVLHESIVDCNIAKSRALVESGVVFDIIIEVIAPAKKHMCILLTNMDKCQFEEVGVQIHDPITFMGTYIL